MKTQSLIQLVVIEEHKLLRKALIDLIEWHGHFSVVGEAGNCDELSQRIESIKVNVDICVIGHNTAEMNSLAIVDVFHRKYPE